MQLLARGVSVTMYEMRPQKSTGAHKSGDIAELVCSNSLKSDDTGTASGLLKAELKTLGCALLQAAYRARVPSGSALAVDRARFSNEVGEMLGRYENFTLVREEITKIPEGVPVIVATGPLTSQPLSDELSALGGGRLYFYDAVAPIVDFESVDMNSAYFGGRYGKGGDDYLNLPMNRQEYEAFYNELINAKTVTLKEFEKKELFEGCMPIEEMAKRGSDTIRFGPLRPVGLSHPVTGEKAYAVVQLRKENVGGDCYNMVGFQTNLTFGEQKRVFGMIPALKEAVYLRYGVMHRNTYLHSPDILDGTLQAKSGAPLYIAGQLSGVEGYMESIAAGLVAGVAMAKLLDGDRLCELPSDTIIGALMRYVSSCPGEFQPMNANFGLLPQTDVRDKKGRKAAYCERALKSIAEYVERTGFCPRYN